jgi:hypothetical protein
MYINIAGLAMAAEAYNLLTEVEIDIVDNNNALCVVTML